MERCRERGRQIELRKERLFQAWDAYNWDESMIDPIEKIPMSDPMRNKKCGHIQVYEKTSFEEYIRGRKRISRFMGGKFRHTVCPLIPNAGDEEDKWIGCTTEAIHDLQPATEMKNEIEKRKEHRTKELEEYPQRKGDFYDRAKIKRLLQSRSLIED